MSTLRATAFVVVVAVFGLTVAPLGGAAVIPGVTDQTSENETDSAQNTSMGAEVSEFMQASAADTDNEVETRMFDAAYENADEEQRADVISDRTAHLEQRLEALENEHSELEEHEDEVNSVAYDARMTRLAVQISALERAVEQTEPRANEYGIATETFSDLRTSIGAFANGEIAERANGLIGIEFSLDQDPLPPGESDAAPGQSDDGETDGDDGLGVGADGGDDDLGVDSDDDGVGTEEDDDETAEDEEDDGTTDDESDD